MAYVDLNPVRAQSRSTYAAVDAMKRSGLGWINKLAAGLDHGRSLGARAFRENRIGRNLGSGLSEGVSAFWCFQSLLPSCVKIDSGPEVLDLCWRQVGRATRADCGRPRPEAVLSSGCSPLILNYE